MRQQSSISSALGLTQREAAKLMGVHPSQWSMFESGKRSLPARASELLATLLAAAQLPKQSATDASQKSSDGKRTKLLEELLRDNAYALEKVRRKIIFQVKAADASVRRQRVADCLDTNHLKRNSDKGMHESISAKTSKNEDISVDVLKLEIKLEVLELEKGLLESKLQGLPMKS